MSLSELEAAIQADPELVRLDQQNNAIAVLTNQTNLHLEQESVAFVDAGVESVAAINPSFVPFPDLVESDGRWLDVQSWRYPRLHRTTGGGGRDASFN